MGLMRSRQILASEASVTQYIPYSHHVTETIISTKNAEYLSVWKIGGRSHQSASNEEILGWTRELNNTLRGLASAHICVWTHIIRRRVNEYPSSAFDNLFCQQLNQKYQANFDHHKLMVNDLYLTVIFRPVADPVLSFFARRARETLAQKTQRQDAAIKQLNDINQTLKRAFKRYDAELLGLYQKNGHTYSLALEFLAQLINSEPKPMPVCRDRFADYMCLNRPFFSTWGEIGEIRTATCLRRFGMVEIREYDDTTVPGQLNMLLESQFEFVLTQSFSTLSRHAAKDFLQRHQRHLVDARDVAQGQIDAIGTALDQLVSGHFIMGEHHMSLLVLGEDATQVRNALAHASSALLDAGLVPKIVDLALEAGFWAQLPANWSYRPRPAAMTSLNFLSFSPFHNFMSGKPTGNPWGPAVTILKTVSGTPLYFNFHASKLEEDATGQRLLGNTMMIGQSSSGKTVALGFLLAQAQKLNPTAIVFDKDRGMEVAILAMGGCYLPLNLGQPSGFNPFQLEPTPANLLFLKEFVKKLAAIDGALTHQEEQEIDQALNTLMFHLDPPLRRLSMLVQGLPNPSQAQDSAKPRASVHARLLKWCQSGPYGWLFDNSNDALDLSQNRLYGFDVTDFLEHPEIRTPLMMYLLYRTENMLDGRRFMYIFDEFWKPLQDEYFADLAKNKQKTIRKQNGIFVFATQDPSDALASPIAKTLIQQCATYIFLPNPKADYEDYTQGFKLTDAEFELIKGLGEFSRRFLIKQGGNSVLAELDLSEFEDELLVLSGTPDHAILAEQIIAKTSADPKIWLPLYLARVRAQKD
ncbi:VirB4 family type IV secretion/conjugal transfer ATPase [Mycoavidus sp. B2-EB]|uniref:VirB4 family type IV secretion/conjugal transfer ATPase n=1 Tax=Mycoavidus sp. B2-EB TaxID=2651972 RepID=UPI0016287E9F|nr:VirB4 family type IV secretion/conjugal transfer ATPase [Mycoavidus sp. B2-EB]BBO60324.1 transporter [Mycoavidus sp. B2-EB]